MYYIESALDHKYGSKVPDDVSAESVNKFIIECFLKLQKEGVIHQIPEFSTFVNKDNKLSIAIPYQYLTIMFTIRLH